MTKLRCNRAWYSLTKVNTNSCCYTITISSRYLVKIIYPTLAETAFALGSNQIAPLW